MESVNAVGRRKAAVARVIVKEGNGQITINKRALDVYFPLPSFSTSSNSLCQHLTLLKSMTSRSTSTAAVTKARLKHSVSLLPALSSRSTPKTSTHSA